MEDITRLTVHELVEKLNKNELSSEKIVKAYKARIEDKEKDVKAFITTTLDEAEPTAKPNTYIYSSSFGSLNQ